MEIQCACGQFKAELDNFPTETPGRVGCYCDDCQSFLIYLNRTDLLDSSGCTEVVPVYPQNLTIKTGSSNLKCIRLTEHGTYRWVASCCNSPIGNTRKNFPWVGLFAHAFNHKDPRFLEKTLGPIKSRVMGKFAKGPKGPHTAEKMNLRAIVSVFPFIFKGKLFKRHKPSPFFDQGGLNPITKPYTLTPQEREDLREQFNKTLTYSS